MVVPAEGILSLVLYRHGIRENGGARVMESLAVLLACAELPVCLGRGAGLAVGRRWSYPQPGQGLLDDLQELSWMIKGGGWAPGETTTALEALE